MTAEIFAYGEVGPDGSGIGRRRSRRESHRRGGGIGRRRSRQGTANGALYRLSDVDACCQSPQSAPGTSSWASEPSAVMLQSPISPSTSLE